VKIRSLFLKLRSFFRSRPRAQTALDLASQQFAGEMSRGEVKCQLCGRQGTNVVGGLFSAAGRHKLGAEPGDQPSWKCALCSECAAAPDARERAEAAVISEILKAER
jgi:hypothetical protein